jgi:hypothetical protein
VVILWYCIVHFLTFEMFKFSCFFFFFNECLNHSFGIASHAIQKVLHGISISFYDINLN